MENGSGTPSVSLESVTKRFGQLAAVDGVSLDIEAGEFFTLLGPSGCGKTTTLRMIAGFEEPTEGAVKIDGVDVVGLPPHKRPTNTVFQSYALFPHLNVSENVAFGLKRQGVDKGEIDKRVKAELERVGLTVEATRKPSQLSGGQQQRVALARALVNLPKVLLLDEPLGALDLKLRKGLQVELKKIQREVGITFVYVTHDQEEALTMSDRIAVMNRGRFEQVGGPVEIYEKPATSFVAGFIGVSNLMPAKVEKKGEVSLETGFKVKTDTDGFSTGESAFAVVRPEKLDIALAKERAPRGKPSIEGRVESSLYLGTATQSQVRIDDSILLTVLCPNTSEAERRGIPGAGEDVRLSWEPEHMHLVRDSGIAVPNEADPEATERALAEAKT